jgi:GTPase SAR1 family protein
VLEQTVQRIEQPPAFHQQSLDSALYIGVALREQCRLSHAWCIGESSATKKLLHPNQHKPHRKGETNMPLAFIIGTAGSGKSLFTAAFSEWLKTSKQDVAVVNLDPGALKLPYSPDVDVRNYVDIGDLMEKYGLGPNGALIMAADLIADEIDNITVDIEAANADVVLVDTPGQMELFAFRASGPYIVNELTREPKAIVYLFDAVFSINPLNYVSNMFLSAAVYNRFFQPQMHLLSKCDLLPEKEVETITDWAANPRALEDSIEQKLKGTKRLFSINMMHAINQLGIKFLLIPVSAKTNQGLTNFNTVLERILTGGEKYTY